MIVVITRLPAAVTFVRCKRVTAPSAGDDGAPDYQTSQRFFGAIGAPVGQPKVC